MPKKSRTEFFSSFNTQLETWDQKENFLDGPEQQAAHQARRTALINGTSGSIFQLWARQPTPEAREKILSEGANFLRQFEEKLDEVFQDAPWHEKAQQDRAYEARRQSRAQEERDRLAAEARAEHPEADL